MRDMHKGEPVFVISILRVGDYCGNNCEPYWEFASYDNYAGSFSTGYPCFDGLMHAITFDSTEDAEQKFEKWWKDFVYGHSNYTKDYDISTLGIRELKLDTVSEKLLTVAQNMEV